MMKKLTVLSSILVLAIALAACSAIKLPGASSNTSQAAGMNLNNMTLEDKLAIGTLKLEGTPKAVTADQAKTLITLWKAVKNLSTNTNTATDEISALYKQIESTLTADQLQSIKDLKIQQSDFQALMQQYGVQGGGPGGQGGPQGTPNATQQAARRSQSGSSGAAQGGPQGGGGFSGPPQGGGDFAGGAPPDGGSGAPMAQGTPAASSAGQAPRAPGAGMNTMWIDALLKILQTRAGQ